MYVLYFWYLHVLLKVFMTTMKAFHPLYCVLYCTVEYKEPKTSLTTFKTKTTFLKTLMLEIQFILYLNGPPPKFRETISLIKAWKLLSPVNNTLPF